MCKIVQTWFAAATEFSCVFRMADTSSYSSEERLVASVWVHERQHTGQTMSQVIGCVPGERHCWIGKNERSLLEVLKTGRGVGEKQRAWKHVQRLPLPLNVPQWSRHGNDRQSLVCHGQQCETTRRNTWMWGRIAQLSNGDMDRRYESCRALLDTFSNAVSRTKVLFSDECAIYRSARDRNVVFWSKENPNFTQELEHNPPHVIWAGMTSDYLIVPYFFDGPVNAASYSAMLETCLIPQLRDRGPLYDVWLQHDGHPHTSLFLCAMSWTNVFQAAGLAVAHRHLRHHCHGHHVVLTLPHHTIRCGVLSREEWLRVATTTTKICAELWKTPFAQLLQNCSDVCHRGHGGASFCVSSIKMHIRIRWTCNQDVRKWFKSNYDSVLVGVRWLLAHPVYVYVLVCVIKHFGMFSKSVSHSQLIQNCYFMKK